jgi:uncharacterized DUF497 family protein
MPAHQRFQEEMSYASFDHPVNGAASRHVALPKHRNAYGPLCRTFNVDTIKTTEITFDPAKNEANIRERGLPFSLVKDEFDWASAQLIEDRRRDYGERRYRALGLIGLRLHAVVYTPRANGMHVISLRKANRREEKRYAAKAESRTD